MRLKAYGITSRQGRQGALLALAAKLPAAILAERIGIYPARAAQWVRAAGATYDDYVTLSERIECHVLPISEFVVKNADCLDWDAFAHAGRRRSGQRTSSARF